jgi:hypothetical protein
MADLKAVQLLHRLKSLWYGNYVAKSEILGDM